MHLLSFVHSSKSVTGTNVTNPSNAFAMPAALTQWDEYPNTLFFVTFLSHLSMVFPIILLFRRRWIWETVLSAATLTTSFMYHSVQAYRTRFILSELQWHRLDNIVAITAFGAFFLYLACIPNPFLNETLKFAYLWITVVLQERAPWDERYTFFPIVCFGAVPVCTHLFYWRRWPHYDWQEFTVGFGCLAVAVGFFIVGLDEAHDPFRMFHCMWHVMGGYAATRLWRVVTLPTNNAAALHMASFPPHNPFADLKPERDDARWA